MLVYSAEPLDQVLRHRVAARGDLAFRNFYGSVEIGRIAWECAAGQGLHLNADCVILEMADDDDVPGAGRSVVVTNLLSHAMPFIRYRLGDRCELLDQVCPCGVPLPLMKPPVGREWDVVRLPSGRLLSPWGFNVFLRDVERLLQFRFLQTDIDRLVLRLRFSSPPDPDVLAGLRERIARHIGEPMTVAIEIVERIDEGALKFRTFISQVDRPS